MADQKTDSDASQQQTPKPCSVLRASIFKSTRPSETKEPATDVPSECKSTNSFFLRPSPLQHQASLLKEPCLVAGSSNSFKLEPPKLICPVSSSLFSSDTETSKDDEVESTSKSKSSQETSNGVSTEKPKFIFGEKLSDRMNSQKNNGSSKEESSGFLFGSNLEEKVAAAETQKEVVVEEENHKEEEKEAKEVQTPEKTDEDSSVMSLAESAALQQAKEVKPELKEVEVVTGEENESNVLQFNAKLHIFEKTTQNWQERGRGLLRLNDMASHDSDDNDIFHSRLVMRAQGSLRVILNIMLWSGMLIEKASSKSVKISAIEPNEGVKIYLITANPNDAEHIYNAIRHRTQQLKSSETRKEIMARKRQVDGDLGACNTKKIRLDTTGDESNDSSSAPYPETEASNEGFTSSSPAVQSSSSSDA